MSTNYKELCSSVVPCKISLTSSMSHSKSCQNQNQHNIDSYLLSFGIRCAITALAQLREPASRDLFWTSRNSVLGIPAKLW